MDMIFLDLTTKHYIMKVMIAIYFVVTSDAVIISQLFYLNMFLLDS